MNIQEFYKDFFQELEHKSSSSGNYKHTLCIEKFITYLEEQGILNDPEITSYATKQGRVDGYTYVEDRGELILFVADFCEDDELVNFVNTDIEKLKNGVLRFYTNSQKQSFHEKMDESSDGYKIAEFIYSKKNETTRLKIILLTNKVLSKRVKEIKENNDLNIDVVYDIWDIGRIFEIESSLGQSEEIKIDLIDTNYSIPALKANILHEEYQSYLCVISGELLANLYEQYGSRLLEANVRSFLQFRGNINKGIRKTIRQEPGLFFSYNNGLTATASEIRFNSAGKIIFLKNLQIVNGGQTTTSLFMTKKTYGADLTEVFVPMKLNIINSQEQADDLIPNISRFANSQNKINDSDFFSNHPFHRKFEECSKRIWAPAGDNNLKQTKWFYERARGSYLNAKAVLSSKAQIKEFESVNPKGQLIAKTDLAKVYLIFDEQPHNAVKGAEIAFREFAKRIGEQWEKNSADFNDLFFKNTIAKIIIYRQCKDIIYRNNSFVGNTKATLLAYSISCLVHLIKSKELVLDLQSIWNQQNISKNLITEIGELASFINDLLNRLSAEKGMAVLSLAKSAQCLAQIFEELEQTNYQISTLLESELIDKNSTKDLEKEAKKEVKVDNEVELLKQWLQIPAISWQSLISEARSKNLVSSLELSLLTMLHKLSLGNGSKVPSGYQCTIIQKVIAKLEDEGVDLLSS